MFFGCHLCCGALKCRENLLRKSLILAKCRSYMPCRDVFGARFSVAKTALLGNSLSIDVAGFVIDWSFSPVSSGSIV